MQYLNSNEALKLNDTFKLYLTVLSVDHERFKATSKTKRTRKRNPQFYKNKKQHVGCNESPNLFKRSWALDIPSSYINFHNIFLNKCLLLCFIIALLQHSYFENNKANKTFLYVQFIASKNARKQIYAGNILSKKLDELISACQLNPQGPYELLSTIKILSVRYNCQFFIFSGVARAKKLEVMYPPTFDDSLKPIYLYRLHDRPDHLILIKNITSFYRAHYRHCFICKKSFSSINYRHMCSQRETCFSCRRFYQTSTTYTNLKLKNEYCDRLITSEVSKVCPTCNLTIFSKNCLKAHKKICYGKGSFGWKCLKCNKFYYRYKNKTSNVIKSNHVCNEPKNCHYCFETNGENHLCRLKNCQYSKHWPLLGFISLEFIKLCTNTEPFLCTAYVQNKEKPSEWLHYSFSDLPELLPNLQTTINLPTFEPANQTVNYNCPKFKKKKDDFITNLTKLFAKSQYSLKTKILQFLMAKQNTTFICQSQHENSDLMVRIYSVAVQFKQVHRLSPLTNNKLGSCMESVVSFSVLGFSAVLIIYSVVVQLQTSTTPLTNNTKLGNCMEE